MSIFTIIIQGFARDVLSLSFMYLPIRERKGSCAPWYLDPR